MAGQSNAPPVIIKRKKVVKGGGHHGGAWKVAYADFVTAMMAFFMLMWLLGATTEKQRRGIADYFNPTVPVNRVSGGGDGSFGGDSPFSEDILTRSGIGATNQRTAERDTASGEQADPGEDRTMADLERDLLARAGESMTMERALRHVVTRVTDEGLVVELFDLEDSPLYEADADAPMPVLSDLLDMIVDVFSSVTNEVAVNGHVRSYPITLIRNPAWELSAARAQAVRGMLVGAGLDRTRVQRVTGFADRRPTTADPMAVRNNRLEIVLLRRRT